MARKGADTAALYTGMDDDVSSLGRGSRVWYRQDATNWVLAEMRDAAAAAAPMSEEEARRAAKKGLKPRPDVAPITLLSGPAAGQHLDSVPVASLMPANPEMQATIPDLTQLSYLNEPSILGNLQLRYSKDAIYTCAGPVLIALNPCKELPLYSEEVQHEYKAAAHEVLHHLSPHVYLVAGGAFRAMVREGASQSIVINGESGAGKTETTKKAMKFLASLAGGPGGVEERVLETNPVLEAFGNAKTLRNHNSSRFGKLVEIHFNQTHHICGARIRTYLLEKSRVVHQLPGERSYHIFYQLVRGADKRLRSVLKLPSRPEDFKYLAQSGCLDIQGVDDAKDFAEVTAALADVGISLEQQDVLFALVTGVLWLGNIIIRPVTDDSSKVEKNAALQAAAAMLGVETDALAHALTHKKIRTRDELIVKPLNAEEAADARDALAKAIYAGVFRWVVTRINESLDTGRRGSGQFIAILDIYGFECFNTNSFEQLCINYANEALQQQFTQHLFTLEQEEYMSEGIDWTKVEWTDNTACLDAIDALPPKGLGVLAVLDSQCKFPKATDDTFVTALRDALNNNQIFSTDPRHRDQFLLRHYAGPVAYSAANFLEKNRDTLNADLIDLIKASSSWLLSDVGSILADETEGRRGGGTVSSRFSSQLKELLAMLDVTGLHFVRCIKPNAALVPAAFTPDLVLSQLRCCGVLEVARVSRAGFPTRYPHAAFVERYRVMLPRAQQAALAIGGGRGVREAIVTLLDAFGVKKGQYEIGHTKVFFRPGVLGYVEDRWARMQEATLKLQATWRMWRLRTAFLRARAAAVLLQSDWRARVQRVHYNQSIKEHRAAIYIQRHYRGAAARAQYQRARAAAIAIQMAARRRALAKRIALRVQEREEREEQEAVERAEVRRREEGFEVIKKRYNVQSLEDVAAAIACYGALRDELGARDPEQVRAAIAIYGALQRFGAVGGQSAQDEAAQVEALKSGLALAAAARKGGASDAAALMAALEVAAAARGALGNAEVTPARVGMLLREHTAAAAALGQNARLLSDPPALADAVSARGEMRAAGLGGAAALAAVVAVGKAAGSSTPEQVSAALALQRAAGDAGPEQVSAALSLQKAAVHAGLPDGEAQAAAGALRKAAAGAEPDQVAAALKLRQAAAAAGLDSPEHLAAAAALSRAAGDSAPEQVAGALALQEAAVVAGLGTIGQLAAAASVQRAAGECTPEQVAAALRLQVAVGDVEQEEVAAALSLGQAAAQAQVGSEEELAVAAALLAVAGDSTPEEVAAALTLQQVVGSSSPEQVAAALQLQATAGDSSSNQVAAALALQHVAGSSRPEEVAAALKLQAVVGDCSPQQVAAALQLQAAAGGSSPEEVAAALQLRPVAGGSSPEEVEAALKLHHTAASANVASPELLASSAALAAAAGDHTPEEVASALELQRAVGDLSAADVAEAIALHNAAAVAGLGSYERLAAAAALAAAVGKSTPDGIAALVQAAGGSTPAEITTALELQQAAQRAGLASPESVASAAALAAAAGSSSPEEVAAALKLRAEVAATGTPTEAKALTAALAAGSAARAAGFAGGSDAEAAAQLLEAARAAGVSDPQEVVAALHSWCAIRQQMSGGDTPREAPSAHDAARRLKRALGMYGVATAHGCAEKRDFVGAVSMYSVLKEEHLTEEAQLRAAAALYSAVREEALPPEELQTAVATWAAMRDEMGAAVAPEDARDALRAFMQRRRVSAAGSADGGAVANGSGGGGGDAEALRQQLQAEKVARQRYALQLEQQAGEWMEQVRLLKEHIDTLRARMPAGAAPLAPPLPTAARRTSASAAVSSLSTDFMGKAPLFEDDAEFIAEVARGASFAPGMDPQTELDLLRRKYDAWNKGFKERLRQAQSALRSSNARHRDKSSSGGGVRGGSGGGRTIDLSSMPDLEAPGLLGDEEAVTARSGDSWEGQAAGTAAAAVSAPGSVAGSAAAPAATPKKNKGIFGLRGL